MDVAYDRVMKGTDLNLLYKKGIYWVGAVVYYAGQELPRRLAPENAELLSDAVAVVDEVSHIYFTPSQRMEGRALWYESEEGWKQAEWTGKMWEIPSAIFQYRIGKLAPVYSGRTAIAIVKRGRKPTEDHRRILTLHLLKKARSEGEGHAQ